MSLIRSAAAMPTPANPCLNRVRSFLTAAVLLLTALQPVLQAASSLPTGGSFTAGSGNISTSGNTLTINQSTLRGIINWNNFSIGQSALVTFKNGSGATLNRVNGGAASSILGQLLASGSIYILNPDGILIGHGATVHTGGDFLATTLNLPDNSFLTGASLTFTGSSPATVVNLGDITSSGGSVYLVGHTVQNGGNLASPNGTSGLAAGGQVLIADTSTNQKVLVQAPGGDVTNSGFIAAAQVELKSNGGNIYALAGNNGGQIQATGTATRDGHVWLIATNGTANVSGVISATNANGAGGKIETSGAHVAIDAARITTGRGGNWLLDPFDLDIDSAAATTIDTSLNAGTSVTLETTATTTSGPGTPVPGNGDINVNSSLSWSTAASLTLSAYRNINIANEVTISNTSSGNLALLADNSASGTGTVNFTGSGSVNFSGSTGNISIAYNPPGAAGLKYTTPTNYASDVMTNGSWSPPLLSSQGYGSVNTQLTAYMLVNNLTDLANIVTNLAGTYGLGTDINANSAPFTPIGGTFTGIFDGMGHTISNLPISSSVTTNVGLFANNTGTIRNIGLFNETLNSSASSGYTGGLAGQNSGIVFASYVNGLVNGPNAGGLVGQNSGTVNNSYSAGSVNGGAGASAGLIYANSGRIIDCYTAANAQYGLVAASTGSPTVVDAYWDTTDTAATSSAAGNGYTRSTLQIAVPAGLISNPYWGGNDTQFDAPLFPYLAWQFPANTTPVAVSGIAYLNQAHTPLANAPVEGIINGAGFGQTVYTGASGYYYFLLPEATVPVSSGVITYLPTHGNAASFYDDFHDAARVALNDNTLPITVGYLTLTNQDYTPSPTLSGIVGDLGVAGSSLIATDSLPFSVNSGVLNLQPGTYLDLIGSGSNSFSLNQSINVTNLVLEGFGPITQTQPLTVTNLSLLGGNAFTLTNPGNLISVLATGPARGGESVPTIVVSPLDNIIPLSINFGNLDVFSASNLLLGSTTAASGVSSLGTVTIQTSQGLTIAPGIQVLSHNYLSAPIPLILADGTTFTNNAGSAALQAQGEGRWQVWSQNPANDTRGGESYAFKQYNAVYGTTAPDQSTGNGFFYTLAPVLTASFAPVTKQYNASTSATGIGSYSLSGAVDGDAVSLLNPPSSGTFADKNVGTNKPITVTGLTLGSASNGEATVYGYSINSTLVADVGTITPAPLTVSISAANKVYDGNTVATGTLGSLNGVFQGDVVSLPGPALFNFATKNADTEITVTASGLTLMGTDAGNYTVAPQTTTANITPAPLFYAPVATTRLYGSNNPAFAGTVTGLVGGDTLTSVATGSATFTSPATSASNVGAYAIDGSGLTLTSGNYTLAQLEGNGTALTIAPAPLFYVGSPVSRAYGSVNPVFTGSVTGLVLDQTLPSVATGTATFSSLATSTSNVGSYAVNGSGLTLTNANYTLEQSAGNSSALSITPAMLTYLANSGITRAYGSTNPIFTGSVTGFVNGQTIASATTGSLLFSSPATIASAAGSYAINGSGLTANFGNYVFTQAPGNASALTITAAPIPTPAPGPITLTIAINNSTDLASQTPAFSATYSGTPPNGINIPSLLGGLTYQITPALNGPGLYTVTASGTAPTGYTLDIVPGSLTVVAGSPMVLPSQVPVIPPVLPVLLSDPAFIAGNFLQPSNSLGLFQVDVISTGANVPAPFSFSGFDSQSPPLAQFSFFSGTNDDKNTYAAGAKP